MSEDDRKPDFGAFDARMARLKAAETGSDGKAGPEGEPKAATHAGLHIGIELVAGVIGGALLGYFLDAWLDTGPLWLIVMLVLGSAAGMLNAHRYIKRLDRERSDKSGTPKAG
ncbi:MAG: AtpZ/AtpI family protein [Geminicoccaceae bacterium]|nr:AtpZ/AtpI family protein [Geminicoccaceae bacterium]